MLTELFLIILETHCMNMHYYIIIIVDIAAFILKPVPIRL